MSQKNLFLLNVLCLIATAYGTYGYSGVAQAQQYGYSQGSYYSQSSYANPYSYSQSSYNTGNNPGNNNAPGYNYSQSSYANPYSYSQSSYSSGGSSNSGDSGSVWQTVQSVASAVWSAGAKTIEAAQTLFTAVQTPKPTYTLLPSGQYLSSEGVVTPTKAPITTTQPVTVPKNITDSIRQQQLQSGTITEVLTPLQKAILQEVKSELGVDISNPAIESAVLLATKDVSSPEAAIARLEKIMVATGGTISGGAIAGVFGQTCASTDCATAQALREASGISHPDAYANELRTQMLGVDARRQKATQDSLEGGSSRSVVIDAERTAEEKRITEAYIEYGTTQSASAEQKDLQVLKETYEEYARTRSVSDDVPMGEAYNALREAERELAIAKQISSGAPIDSQEMFAYADAKKRYDQAVISYQKALAQIENYQEPEAKLLAQQAISDAQDSSIVSKLLTTPNSNTTLDRSSGSGIRKPGRISPVVGYEIEDKDNLNDEYGAPRSLRRLHAGVDIGAPIGTPTVAARDGGVVTEVGWQRGYGNVVGIEYPDGTTDFYAHLDSQTVEEGDVVNTGDQIGTVGVSGMRNPSPHLHYEVRRTGVQGSQSSTYSEEALDRTRLDPANLQGDAVSQNGVFMDFDKYVEDVHNGTLNNDDFFDTSTPVPQDPRTTTEKIVEAVVGFLTNPIGTFLGLFNGGSALSTNNPPNTSNNTTTHPVVPPPPPRPASDLTTTALGAQPTGTSTHSTSSIEYKFSGSIARKIIYGEDGLPVSDIRANYADTLYSALSVDYFCDGTADTHAVFPLAYTAFDATEENSLVLISKYLPLTTQGTHCFFFETDIRNVVTEKDEQNNKSNVYRFIVGS